MNPKALQQEPVQQDEYKFLMLKRDLNFMIEELFESTRIPFYENE